MEAKTLFESVMWGTSKQVQNILDKRDLTIDDKYTDYALLLTALRRKRKEITKILLHKGCRVKKVPRNDAADTPLHLAVKMGDVEIVKMLLDKGAAVDTMDQNGETPLYFAMKKGYNEIVDLILSASDVDCINTSNKNGFSHFHIACIRNNVSAAESFIKKGVNVNCSVNFDSGEYPGYTALHFAVQYNCVDILKLLLSCNADPTVKNAEDKTPLFLAMQKQNNEIADIILSSMSIEDSNPVDDYGLSHFHIACMKHHLRAVENFLQRGIDINQAVKLTSSFGPGYTALHFAVKGSSLHCRDQVAVIELLLKHKADVYAKDVQGQTPLHLACLQRKILKLMQDFFDTYKTDAESTDSALKEKLTEIVGQTDQAKIVDLLLKHKSDVNIKNILNETPLFYLYKFHHPIIFIKNEDNELANHVMKEFNKKRSEIVKILLNHGADVNVQNDIGQSLLHLIAGINKAYDDDQKEEVAELMLSRGADVDAKAKYGSTPLHLASKNGHEKLIELFLHYKADVNACEPSDQSTPLHLATSFQQPKAIDILLNNGADVNALKCNGMNVLHIMALMNPDASEEPHFIETYDTIINSFIERGCDVNAQDINGRTPLHLASWEHNAAGTWTLLVHFADINVEDFAGETALSFPINSTERCVNIFYIFKDFINILKLAGLHVSEKNEAIYDKMYKSEFLHKGDDLLVQCREEIERMKGIKINNHTTLYDIMFKNSNEMVVYAGNEILEEILNSNDFSASYNIYKNLLKSQFRRGLMRKNLLRSAKESLEFLINLGLPDSCSDQIFQYLSDKNLNDLAKAKTVSVVDSKVQAQQITCDLNDSESLKKALAYCKNLFDRQMEIDIT